MTPTVKKAAKKTTGNYVENGITYNQFGVCLDCNGGREDCLHNNLVEDQGKTYCATCGLVVKE